MSQPTKGAGMDEQTREMKPANGDRPAQAKPCIHTLETGKHEWNCFHWVHQAYAPFSYPQCPTCGWIDLDLMVKEAGLVRAEQAREEAVPAPRAYPDCHPVCREGWDQTFGASEAAPRASAEAFTVEHLKIGIQAAFDTWKRGLPETAFSHADGIRFLRLVDSALHASGLLAQPAHAETPEGIRALIAKRIGLLTNAASTKRTHAEGWKKQTDEHSRYMADSLQWRADEYDEEIEWLRELERLLDGGK